METLPADDGVDIQALPIRVIFPQLICNQGFLGVKATLVCHHHLGLLVAGSWFQASSRCIFTAV